MKTPRRKARETAEFLKAHITDTPEVALLIGTGLGDSVRAMDIRVSLEYKNIPHFPVSTVVSHIGKLLFGTLAGKKIIALQGRFHLYEGYSPAEVTFPIRVLQELGVAYLIVSNAAGGLNPCFKTGDIMIIVDHINLTGDNPLIGPNDDRWGSRFPDMIGAYDKTLRTYAETAGKNARISLQKGVYVGLKGPSLETPAEVRFLRKIGAEAVGFSTVQEVIAAVHAGIKILGLSIITNVHNPDHPVPAKVDEIIAVANKSTAKLESIIAGVIQAI